MPNSTPPPPVRPSIHDLPWLFAISFMTFGCYFAYRELSAIENYLLTQGMSHTNLGNAELVFGMGSAIATLLAGPLIDRLRALPMCFGSSLAAFVGAVILNNWTTPSDIYVGRFVFSVGMEALVISQLVVLTQWFPRRTFTILAFATTVNRLAEFLASYAQPPFLIATLSCLASAICALLVWVASATMRNSYAMPSPKAERVVPGDLRFLPFEFWFLSLLGVIAYTLYLPFLTFAPDFITSNWAPTDGSKTIAWIFVVHLFFGPLGGAFIDSRKKELDGHIAITLGFVIVTVSYLMFLAGPAPPILPTLTLASATTLLFVAVWPMIPRTLTDQRRLGTAYASFTCLQTLSVGAATSLIGYLRRASGDYRSMMVLFAAIGATATVLSCVYLWTIVRSRRKQLEEVSTDGK